MKYAIGIVVFLALMSAHLGADAAEKGRRSKEPAQKTRLEYASERNMEIGCDGQWLNELLPKEVPVAPQPTQTKRKKSQK